MKKDLITSFFCSECGRELDFLTESDIQKKWADDAYVENITEAEKERTSLYIQPCPWCVLKHTTHARMVSAGLKRLLEMEDK